MGIIFLFSFLTLMTIFYVLTALLLTPFFKVQLRLEKIEEIYGQEKEVEEEDRRSISFQKRVLEPVYYKLKKNIQTKAPRAMLAGLEVSIERAGHPYGIGLAGWVMIKFVFTIFMFLFLVFGMAGSDMGILGKVLMVVVGTWISFKIPNAVLSINMKNRKQTLTKQLPDILDLLSVSVEAGLSFDGAIAKLVEKNQGELAREFGKVLNEIQLGKTRKDALKSMDMRCGVGDITIFISSLIQAEKLGVSTSKILKVQSAQMRVKRKQRAEELAIKAPVKMMLPLVFFVFPSIFIVILGPALITIKDFFLSR